MKQFSVINSKTSHCSTSTSFCNKGVEDISKMLLIKSVFHWQYLISYIFSVFLQFGAGYIMVQWGEFRILLDVFIYFFGIFMLFFIINFLSFRFFFWWRIRFLPHSINQSEKGIGEKKLSVEMILNIIKWRLEVRLKSIWVTTTVPLQALSLDNMPNTSKQFYPPFENFQTKTLMRKKWHKSERQSRVVFLSLEK